MKSPLITFRCHPELREAAEKAAKKDGRSLSNWIVKVISDAVNPSSRHRAS